MATAFNAPLVSSPWALTQAELDAYDADRAFDDAFDAAFEERRDAAFDELSTSMYWRREGWTTDQFDNWFDKYCADEAKAYALAQAAIAEAEAERNVAQAAAHRAAMTPERRADLDRDYLS